VANKLHSLSEAARTLGTYVDKVKFYAALAGVALIPAGTAFVIDDDGLAKIKAEMKRAKKPVKKSRSK